MSLKKFTLRLESTDFITPHVKHFRLRYESSDVFKFTPGQFITLLIPHNDKMIRRSYSIANAPSDDNLIEFAAGFVKNGIASEYLFHLKVNDTLDAMGPFGRLILKPENPKRYIFVATSTGVTPYRAMRFELLNKLEKDPALEIVILQGAQSRQDILYKNDFLNLCNQNSRIKFHACLSRELNIENHDIYKAGYVQNTFPHLNLNPEQDIVYLCGNPNMIDTSFTILKQHGFTETQIVREKYISGKS